MSRTGKRRCPHCNHFFSPKGLPNHEKACAEKLKGEARLEKDLEAIKAPTPEEAWKDFVENRLDEIAETLANEEATTVIKCTCGRRFTVGLERRWA